MNLDAVLRGFVEAVSDEADRNPEFAERLRGVFEGRGKTYRKLGSAARAPGSRGARPANRRPPPVLDPVAIARQGEEELRSRLAPLTLDQLKDIVADYGMDRDRLAMRWKTSGRVIDRIVEISMSRARKGDVFLR